MIRLFALLLVSSAVLRTEEVPRPWRETLNQIRTNVAKQIVRADNYICVQDLSRFYYSTKTDSAPCEQPPHVPNGEPTMKDRLRLDVTVSEGNEIYAWHGEKQFSSKSLIEMVQHGPVSSGGFTGYLRNIFVSAGIEFTYHEPTLVNGQPTYSFEYRVPRKVSRYQIKTGNQMLVVPFHGWFTADAHTLDIETLTVIADSDAIPRDAELCAIQSTVTYELAHISTSDSLIPKSFDMIYGSSQGRMVTDSKGEYSQCRQFSGESTVRFDGEESAGAASQVDVQASTMKPGVMLKIALATDIDSDSAYAGMQVVGTLAHPAKIGNGVVLPSGTRVEGMVTRFETYYSPEPQTLLIIQFDHLVAGNKSYSFKAIHPVDLYQSIRSSPRMGPAGGRRSAPPSIFKSAEAEEPGVLRFPKATLHLDKKFVSEYETVATK